MEHLSTLFHTDLTEQRWHRIREGLGLTPIQTEETVEWTPDAFLQVRPDLRYLAPPRPPGQRRGGLTIPPTERWTLKSFAEAIIQQYEADWTLMGVLNDAYRDSKNLSPFSFEQMGTITIGTDTGFNPNRLCILDGNKRALVWAVGYLKGELPPTPIRVKKITQTDTLDRHIEIRVHRRARPFYPEMYRTNLTTTELFQACGALKIESVIEWRLIELASVEDFLAVHLFSRYLEPPRPRSLQVIASALLKKGGARENLHKQPDGLLWRKVYHELQTFDRNKLEFIHTRSSVKNTTIQLQLRNISQCREGLDLVAYAMLLMQGKVAYKPIQLYHGHHKRALVFSDYYITVIVNNYPDKIRLLLALIANGECDLNIFNAKENVDECLFQNTA